MTNPFDTYAQETKDAISFLVKQAVLGKEYANDFAKRNFNGIREKALLHFLNRAVDLSDGCARLAVAGLSTSLTTLSRSLLELLFWERWVIQCEDNANRFREGAINEAKGLMKIYLETGQAVAHNKRTGNIIKNKAVLNSEEMQNLRKLPSVETVAAETGLTRAYDIGYRILSMSAHGKAFALFDDISQEEEVLYSASVASVSMECINLVAQNWIIHRHLTEPDQINTILDAADII